MKTSITRLRSAPARQAKSHETRIARIITNRLIKWCELVNSWPRWIIFVPDRPLQDRSSLAMIADKTDGCKLVADSLSLLFFGFVGCSHP